MSYLIPIISKILIDSTQFLFFIMFYRYEFASCGLKNITLWEMSGRNLLRKKVVNVQEETNQSSICITCLSYISYSLGD